MQVLDKGEVKLIESMGHDLAVVAAARVSNGVAYENASKGTEKDAKLIRYLLKHNHGTPFEHSIFTFYVKCPIFVAREWMRHRIASYNEISGRYVEFEPEFYIPEKYRVPGTTNKQGSRIPSDDEWITLESPTTSGGKKIQAKDDWCGGWHSLIGGYVEIAYEEAFDTYKTLLEFGLAKEMARMVLPVALYTQFYFTVNARSLMNFLNLRTAEDAQWEIRQYANAIEEIFAEKMPMTYQAWLENK